MVVSNYLQVAQNRNLAADTTEKTHHSWGKTGLIQCIACHLHLLGRGHRPILGHAHTTNTQVSDTSLLQFHPVTTNGDL